MKLSPFYFAAGFLFFAMTGVQGAPGDVDFSFNPNANDEVDGIGHSPAEWSPLTEQTGSPLDARRGSPAAGN